MAIQPPEIEAFPPEPQRGNKDTFADLFDAVITWFGKSVSKIGQACQAAYQNAVEAAASAFAAEAAAEAATFISGAVQWVSGTSYVKGKVVWSPLDGRTYRRLVAGAGATDPSLDQSNWVVLSNAPAHFALLASATVTTAVANIDFLNIFSPLYDKYTIEVQDLTSNANPALNGQLTYIQLAYGGQIDLTSASYQGSVSSLGVQLGATNTNGPIVATVEIRNVNAGSLRGISVSGLAPQESSVTAVPIFRINESSHRRSAPCSGFRILASNTSGAIPFTGGTIRIYGHRNNP